MTSVGIFFLAVVDSINPSAIVVTLWLLSTAGAGAHRQVAMYIGTIFVTYLLLGITMVLGVGVLLPSLDDLLGVLPGLIIQSFVGLALLVYSMTAPAKPSVAQASSRLPARTYAALILLGITVTVMELPTAVPYFAAIALLVEAQLPLYTWALLLGLYNLIFILPPLTLLLGHLFFQQRLAASYASLRQRLESGAQNVMLWVAGLVGGWLFVTGIIELVARLR